MIYGRAHSGKTQYILNLSERLYKENKPFIILVPEQFTHLAEKRLISKIGSIQEGRAEVLSFDRVAKRINATYPNNKKRINNVAKSLIMSEIVASCELSYYKNISRDAGFTDVCISEISEFKKYNYTCDDVFTIANKVDDKGLSMKLNDLGTIYKKYEEHISSSYSDSEDELAILAQNLTEHNPYSGYTFIFDEFSSFNPIEKKIISCLSNECENIYMSFCLDTDSKYKYLFKTTLDTAASIIRICEKEGTVIEKPVVLDKTYYASDELSFLEENLFAFGGGVYSDICNNVRIYTSDNPYNEITNLAMQIKKLVSKNNIRYRDISVICTDISSYSHIFRSVFSSFDIPYFIDEKTEVLRHSVICHTLNILDVYLYNYNPESVINYLKSGYIEISRTDLINIDSFIKATGASKNTYLKDEKWEKVLSLYCENDERLKKSLNNVRQKYILPLSAFHDSIKGKNTVKYVSEKLYSFLLSTKFDKTIADYIKYFKSKNNTYMAKQYEAVWDVLIESLDMLVFILGDKSLNVSEYRAYLYTALSEQKTGTIPTSPDSIIIGDVKRSRSEFALFEFVVGVCDGVFPASNKEDSIISDADKLLIKEAGFEFSLTSHDNAFFDRFLMYSSLTHPSKALVLSYPLQDNSYKATRPAFVITLLKKIFPSLSEITAPGSDKSAPVNETMALEYLAQSAYTISNGGTADENWNDVYAYFKNKNSDELNKINSFIYPPEKVIKLNKEYTDALFKDEFYSTISRIQKYNSCRYRYYLEYMLGLKEQKSFETDARDVGNFVHAIIEKAFETAERSGVNIEDTTEEYFSEICAPLFEERKNMLFAFSDELSAGEEYKFEMYKKMVIKSLMNIRSHLILSPFKPIGHEITFDDDNIGCIEINLDNGKKLKITGKIDRADSFENEDGTYVRVVDYKTGNKTFSLNDVYHGLDIQLIIYLNTLVKNTPNAHHAGALYLKIFSPVAEFNNHPDDAELGEELLHLGAMTGLVADNDTVCAAFSPNSIRSAKKATFTQFEYLSKHVEDMVKKSAGDMSQGFININPYEMGDSTACDLCPYMSVCKNKSENAADARKLTKSRDDALWKTIISEKAGDDK